MIGILHRYVFWEVFKAFVLTAVGLTLMFAMGGGLLNLIRIEQQVSLGDVAKLLLWFIPLVASFMLPIAALLSAALTYGRLSADNELDACKASGVNIVRLLAASVVLAVVVGVATFYLSNFTVPGIVRQLDQLAQLSADDLVVTELKDRGYIKYANRYGLFADNAEKLTPEQVREALGESAEGREVIFLQGAAFVEFGTEEPVRTGTAETALLIFDHTTDPLTLRAVLRQVEMYDHERMQFGAADELAIEPSQLPMSPMRTKLKFFDLFELFRLQRRPLETPAMQDRLAAFRHQLARLAFAEYFLEQLNGPQREVVIPASWGRYRVRARQYNRDDVNMMIRLRDVVVHEEQTKTDARGAERVVQSRQFRADGAEVTAEASAGQIMAQITLTGNVTLQDPQEGQRVVRQSAPHDLRGVPIPLSSLADVPPLRIGRIPDAELVSGSLDERLPPDLRSERRNLAAWQDEARRTITSVIHSRLTLSLSTVVLVLLAASLGIVIRGGHALTAFGVAFIPTVIVVIIIIMGRQLAEKPVTAVLGLGVMWGILAVMAVVDATIVMRYIRR